MQPRILYNDNDPNVIAWVKQLIVAGDIPDGHVDGRSILDIKASDLDGFDYVHLFCGIAGWEQALKLAGIDDSRRPVRGPIFTVSCPCPPFSSAGKKKACPQCGGSNPIPCPSRVGYFTCCSCDHSWFADERHLWPHVADLIDQCSPATVFGEQVSSADGRVWFSIVRFQLEAMGYACWGADLCAAGVGAPHIRQRLYFVAESGLERREGQRLRLLAGQSRSTSLEVGRRRETVELANATSEGRRRTWSPGLANGNWTFEPGRCSEARSVADSYCGERDGLAEFEGRERDGSTTGREQSHGEPERSGEAIRIADAGCVADERLGELRLREARSANPADEGQGLQRERGGHHTGRRREDDDRELGDAEDQRHAWNEGAGREAWRGSEYASGLVDAERQRLEGHDRNVHDGDESGRLREDETRPVTEASVSGRMADADEPCSGDGELQQGRGLVQSTSDSITGFWSDCIWIPCTDRKLRPTKPSIKPLAAGLSRKLVRGRDPSAPIDVNATQEARIVRLKGYGNSIVPQLAAMFIKAYEDTCAQEYTNTD